VNKASIYGSEPPKEIEITSTPSYIAWSNASRISASWHPPVYDDFC
jgi:hypothetical protein